MTLLIKKIPNVFNNCLKLQIRNSSRYFTIDENIFGLNEQQKEVIIIINVFFLLMFIQVTIKFFLSKFLNLKS